MLSEREKLTLPWKLNLQRAIKDKEMGLGRPGDDFICKKHTSSFDLCGGEVSMYTRNNIAKTVCFMDFLSSSYALGFTLSLNSTRVRTLKKKNKVENQKVPTDAVGRLAYQGFLPLLI